MRPFLSLVLTAAAASAAAVPAVTGSTAADVPDNAQYYPGQQGMNPGMMNPGLMNPGMNNPALMNPGMNNPALMNPGMNNPALMNPGMAGNMNNNMQFQPAVLCTMNGACDCQPRSITGNPGMCRVETGPAQQLVQRASAVNPQMGVGMNMNSAVQVYMCRASRSQCNCESGLQTWMNDPECYSTSASPRRSLASAAMLATVAATFLLF